MDRDLLRRYADLRRTGYGPWAAGVELGLTEREHVGMEALYIKPRHGRLRPPKPPVAPPPPPAYSEPEPPEDSEYVSAVLDMGGYPTGDGSMWRGPDGQPWQGWAA